MKSKYNYAPEIVVGSKFARIDKRGSTWIATVIRRTDYYVYVKLVNPYNSELAIEEDRYIIREDTDSKKSHFIEICYHGYPLIYNLIK